MVNDIKTSLSFTFSQLNLNISTAAFARLNSSWNCSDAYAPFSRIYCVTGGEGIIIYNGEEFKLLPGMICVLPSRLNFEYRCDSELEKMYFHLQLQYSGQNDICSKIQRPVFLENRFEQINEIRELFFDETLSLKNSFMLKSHLAGILSDAFKATSVSIGNAVFYSEQILRAHEYINEHLKCNLTINEIADSLFISPSQLQKRFKAETGKSIGHYIKDQIMSVAEQKLRTSTRTIRDISEELGFCDQFFFSRTFTNFYGISPRAYRNKINEQNIF